MTLLKKLGKLYFREKYRHAIIEFKNMLWEIKDIKDDALLLLSGNKREAVPAELFNNMLPVKTVLLPVYALVDNVVMSSVVPQNDRQRNFSTSNLSAHFKKRVRPQRNLQLLLHKTISEDFPSITTTEQTIS